MTTFIELIRHPETCLAFTTYCVDTKDRFSGSDQGWRKCTINVVDISTTGFRMECLTYLSDSQVILLTKAGFEPLEARIKWQTEWMYGCEFARPLYIAIYEHIVRSHPSLEPQPTASEGFMYGAAAGLQWH